MSCSPTPDGQTISIISQNKDSVANKTINKQDKNTSVKITNTTSFSTRILLEATGDIFQNPDSEYYYSIGKSKIVFIDESPKKFLIPEWSLEVHRDSIIFNKYSNAKNNNAIYPKAFINYSSSKKYIGIKNNYTSNYFGAITISETGLSCDDSFSGKVTINKDGKELFISGLANIDIFESKDKELYIVSYHNCLVPDLKIIRIK